jgi:hypothetical protein
MIRWTNRDEDGEAYVIPVGEKREYGKPFDALADYEDLGLTPDEIRKSLNLPSEKINPNK